MPFDLEFVYVGFALLTIIVVVSCIIFGVSINDQSVVVKEHIERLVGLQSQIDDLNRLCARLNDRLDRIDVPSRTIVQVSNPIGSTLSKPNLTAVEAAEAQVRRDSFIRHELQAAVERRKAFKRQYGPSGWRMRAGASGPRSSEVQSSDTDDSTMLALAAATRMLNAPSDTVSHTTCSPSTHDSSPSTSSWGSSSHSSHDSGSSSSYSSSDSSSSYDSGSSDSSGGGCD